MSKQLPFPIPGYTPGKFSLCSWCNGRGCAACDGEAMKHAERLDAEYRRQFPNGPTCVTIPLDRLADAKGAIGADALLKAFGDGGGGVVEVFNNLEILGFGKPKPIENSEGSK